MLVDSEVESVKALREATDELTSQDLNRLFDNELEYGVVEIRRQLTRLEAVWLGHTAEMDRRQTFLTKGYASMGAWLAHRCRMAYGRAKHTVGVAHALQDMPATAEAYAAGDVDSAAVNQLVKARCRNAEVFERDEKMLVDTAKDLSPRDFTRALAYWQDAADAEAAAADAEAQYLQRRLHVSVTLGDMVRLDGELDPESGQMVKAAISANVDARNRNRDDTRTAGQKRADALIEICRYYLDYADTPQTGGEKPHISLIVDLERLTDGVGRSEYGDGTVITASQALRIACDASISRIITKGPSEVLDVGRRTRTVTAAQRRALAIRDGGCVEPGCEVPPWFCDVHHKTPWAHGGSTNLKDLELRCRPDHIHVHNQMTHGEERSPPSR